MKELSLDKLTAKELHNELLKTCQSFKDFFISRGYLEIAEEPAIPLEDETILLSNSAVVPFKRYLGKNQKKLQTGVFVSQNCFRSQNLKTNMTDFFHRDFMLSFNMLGVLAPVDQAEKFARDVYDYLVEVCGFDSSSMIYKSHSSFQELNKVWMDCSSSVFKASYDVEESDYYNWKFGVEGLRGQGATFCSVDDSGFERDLGNWMEFIYEEKTQALGLGFGVETLIACTLRSRWVADITPSLKVFRGGSEKEAKIADLSAYLIKLFYSGIRIGGEGREYLYKKAFKQVDTLVCESELSKEEYLCKVLELEKILFGSNNIGLEKLFQAQIAEEVKSNFDLAILCPEHFTIEKFKQFLSKKIQNLDVSLKDRYESEKFPQGKVSMTFAITGAMTKSDFKELVEYINSCPEIELRK